MSARQRQQEKKIKVLQTPRTVHSYMSGTYYSLFCCYCCCGMKWEIFLFEMLLWISVSTVKPVKSKHCSIHTYGREMHSQHAFKAVSLRSHKFWAARRRPQRGLCRPLWTRGCRKVGIGLKLIWSFSLLQLNYYIMLSILNTLFLPGMHTAYITGTRSLFTLESFIVFHICI